MIHFLYGIAAAGSLGVGLIFFRLWRETRDRFFVLFALSFWVLSLVWFLLVWAEPFEHRHYLYALRLAAFLLILGAIVAKNRSSR